MISLPNASIGVAIITHNSRRHLAHCLPPLLGSPLRPRVLVVNSSSADGTVEEAQRLGAETLVIPRDEFNHGCTRELARKHLATDIVMMMTPDAYPLDASLVEVLTAPLRAGVASAAYARQIPHNPSDVFEALPREFNYPPQGHVRGIDDVASFGVYSIFCSDSCSAYVNSALDEIGGFMPVLTAEDAFAVAMLLSKGHKIAYVAEAVVKHSHRYGLMQEFRRYFDTGLVRRRHRDIIAFAGSDSRRGRQFARQLLARIRRDRPAMLPYAVLHVLAKWLGYKVGCASVSAPLWIKKTLSSQDYYWSSKTCDRMDKAAI